MNPAVAPPGQPELKLAFGLSFPDLYEAPGLRKLDAAWQTFLAAADPDLAERFTQARSTPNGLSGPDQAALLIELGLPLQAFIAALFGIEDTLTANQAAHTAWSPLLQVKWKFVRRQAVLGVTPEQLATLDVDRTWERLRAALRALPTLPQRAADDPAEFDEQAFAQAIVHWQTDATHYAATLTDARLYSAWAATTPAGQARHRDGVLFRLPQAVLPEALLDATRLHTTTHPVTLIRSAPPWLRRRLRGDRAAFAHTDRAPQRVDAMDAARYCLSCHKQGQDSCSKGLRATTVTPAPAQRSAQGVALEGCPLEERISEFLTLKGQGLSVAALAMITLDNPMVAGTGHRICNDCMKSCIFQQQTPVDVPRAETQTLQEVLDLPWGFEIYGLLTRWNPLNLQRPVPAPDSGYRVLVVGTGPAGFTLAHHLLNDGHTVVAIDGLKIEPLPAAWTGVDAHTGARQPLTPIHDIAAWHEPLDQRIAGGFGGVAEYGITARWDKNFLTLIRLLLQRRQAFHLLGGVRFGGTLTAVDAWALGFDHIALAVGAGRPTVLDIPNGLARGVRTASDFLMSLQQSGAARFDALVNLQMRLPVLVIGGGLTAIDTATEALAYYTVQVEKFCARYEALLARHDAAAVRAGWTAEECAIADEFLDHARALRTETRQAAAQGRPARLTELLDAWGGVTVVYRKRLVDSPAYALNHEELAHALEEGVRFAEALVPDRIDVDAHGAVQSMTFRPAFPDGTPAASPVTLPARTVLLAMGTAPNTELAHEYPEQFGLDGRYFQACDEHGQPITPALRQPKPDAATVLLATPPEPRRMSFFGDAHPSWFGNVVKAMASAQRGWPVVARTLRQHAPVGREPHTTWSRRLYERLSAQVVRTARLGPRIVELIIHAPQAAQNFQPGQFFRLQTFERNATVVAPPAGPATRLAMEALALTGAWVDRAAGLISTIVLEMGGSTQLCAQLVPGQPVVLMGPTGAPTAIVADETVVLVGGGLGNAVLFSIGAALRAAGSRVVYFAGYRTLADRFKVEAIEAAADIVVWCCEQAPGFVPNRPQDRSFVGNVVQAMLAWAQGLPLQDAEGRPDTGPRPVPLAAADRWLAIGSDRMMAAVARARHGALAPYLKPGHVAMGSINSPMQCMMKGICAQCLQTQHDPVTGATRYVFSCVEQDQPLDWVDFSVLDARLKQNALQEKLTATWLQACLQHGVVQHRP